jgi:hypothetical protein
MERREEGKKTRLPFLPFFPSFHSNAAFLFRNGIITASFVLSIPYS